MLAGLPGSFLLCLVFSIIEVQLLTVFQVHSKGIELRAKGLSYAHTLSFSDSFPLQIIT